MDVYGDMVGPLSPRTVTSHAGRGDRTIVAGVREAGTPQTCDSADEIFAQAVRDDSNRELDWLWVYVHVIDADQRRYCLERALAITPRSEIALRELRQLLPKLV
jgi:hypothetical protein